MNNPHSLPGKKALVTGGKRRIGRGIALSLAEAGCDVGINDIVSDADADETMRLIRERSCEAQFFQADISNSLQVEAMFTDFHKRFGRIDILVNNPYGGTGQPFLDISEENWDANIDIGLKGFFLCSQQAARAMVEQGDGGSIVSTSSVHGARAWKGDTAYGTAKAGILRMTESMAVDLGQFGSRCNAILPGHMDTTHEIGTPPPERGSIQEGSGVSVPLLRRGTPEDIGRAGAFLCSPGAACITGVSIAVDGGRLGAGPGAG